MTRGLTIGSVCGVPGKLWLMLYLFALLPTAVCPAQSQLVVCGDSQRGQREPMPAGDYMAVCAGGHHNLALIEGGRLLAWGENSSGQCNAPQGSGFTAIAAGLYHSLALRADGSVIAWGDNSRGQCDVPPDRRFVAIAAGSWHSLAICSDGSLMAWGWNDQGQCRVPSGTDYTRVAAGYAHSVALKADRSIVAWGSNGDKECDVPRDSDFVAVAAGALHNLALRANGTVVAWGRQAEGQCMTPSGGDFVSIAAGYLHSLALKRDGAVVAWGDFSRGQCDLPADERFASIAAFGLRSLALTRPAGVRPAPIAGDVREETESDRPAQTSVPNKPAITVAPVKSPPQDVSAESTRMSASSVPESRPSVDTPRSSRGSAAIAPADNGREVRPINRPNAPSDSPDALDKRVQTPAQPEPLVAAPRAADTASGPRAADDSKALDSPASRHGWLHAVQAWVGRPADMIATVVLIVCVLAIVAMLWAK